MVDSITREVAADHRLFGRRGGATDGKAATRLGKSVTRFRTAGGYPLHASAAALLIALLLSGCGQFFAKTTSTGTTGTGTTTNTGDSLYIANDNTALDTVAGFSLASGTLTATASSPYTLAEVPSTLALTPSNSILYVGSEFGGVSGYLVGSDGALTSNGLSAASISPAALAVDSTGNWLLALQNGTTNPILSAFPINTSTGALTSAINTITLDAGSSGIGSLVLVPNSTLVYASLGTGGVDALSFDSTTGTLTDLNVLLAPLSNLASDNGLATDPTGKFLFVSETVTNGIRSFTINSDGTLTQVGSPVSAGSGVGKVVVDSTGAFLYVANKFDGTISAYSISTTGALTAITGSPFATGASPLDMAEDNSKGYLAVACFGGTPDLQLFAINATTGALTSTVTQSTGSTSPAGAYAVVASH